MYFPKYFRFENAVVDPGGHGIHQQDGERRRLLKHAEKPEQHTQKTAQPPVDPARDRVLRGGDRVGGHEDRRE